MSRTATIVIAGMLAAASTVQAQTPANPLSANFKASWANISSLLAKMAEKMPEENYRFKPTPEMQDFGARVAQSSVSTCVGAPRRREMKPLMFSAAPTKAEVLAAMKETNAYCDAVFNA